MDTVRPSSFEQAFEAWLNHEHRTGTFQHESSGEMYQHMWGALAQWCIGRGLPLESITSVDLHDYLQSRGEHGELSARYAWRLLRLVDRVLAHQVRAGRSAPNRAAIELLDRRPDWRFANAAEDDPLPDHLSAAQARALVRHLCAVRPRLGAPRPPWQDLRNRAAVACMLGAGLTPGEVRGLKIADVTRHGGGQTAVPWKLRLPGNGNSPGRETPVAAWAGRVLSLWLQVREEQEIPGDMVFVSTRRTGRDWGKVAQYNATREVLQAAGVEATEGGSYRLRHTFALRQLRRGRSPEEVARWLGLADASAMSRYTRLLLSPVDLA